MDIRQSLSNIYMTLSSLEIKSTPTNVKYLFGIQSEIENLLSHIEQESGEGDEQQA